MHETHLFVPGRLEFLGKHTDYAGGRSLVCALERGIHAIVEPASDVTLRIHDANSDEVSEFPISAELSPRQGHWSVYAMTVVRRVARNFPGPLKGARIGFRSDLPQAAGMSSSSALMIAIFLALDAVNDLRARSEYELNIRTPLDLAGYLATIENGQSFGTLVGDSGVGTFGGSEDHTAIVCGRAGTLSQYSFCPVNYERDVRLPDVLVFAIASSGVVAQKTGAAKEAYNRLSQSAARIVQQWNGHTGRKDPTLAAAVRSAPEVSDVMRRLLAREPDLVARLDQFVEESEQLVPAAGDALQTHDLPTLGRIVARSHEMAERFLGNQVPESIALVRQASELGAVASSAFGAGFGGSVWALVETSGADEFVARWSKAYLGAHPNRAADAQFFLSGAGPGATTW